MYTFSKEPLRSILKDDLRQLGKYQFLALHSGAKKRILAKLIRRLYLNEADCEAIEHYERLRGYDETFPPLPKGAEGLSALYHQLMESIKPTGGAPQILPQIRRLDQLEKLTPFLPFSIYLDQIRSAYNLGSIIRTCEAFRLGSIHLSPFCPSKGHKEIAKTALGAEHHVEIFENARLEDLPRPWIALETGTNAYNYASFPFPQAGGTLIFGNEEFGVSNTILAKADYLVEIPLQGVKNSLNVANAFSIIASSIRNTFS